jgi:2-oxoglutarate dehydrogenase E2 component (dihydrolipoamide succinyltransferase)
MTVKVFAPLIGEGVEELSLVAWKKKPGDSVTEGEPLAEIESDKVVTELQSPATGSLVEILAQAGDTVRAGAVVAILDGAALGEQTGGSSNATPENSPSSAPAAAADTVRPHGALRRKIAERMIASQRISAHVLTVMEADMSAVLAHRETNKEAYAKDGVKLALSAYFVAVLAAALRRHPEFNSSWSEEGMILHPDINIGIAVSLGEGGLIVPVLKRADGLSLDKTAREIDRLATAARAGTLDPEDVQAGTFTLTNHGTGHSLFAAPIINQPQIGILGAGAVQKRAVVAANAEGLDSIYVRPMVYLSLVFDHRALDGEAADSFLLDVKKGLESWA